MKVKATAQVTAPQYFRFGNRGVTLSASQIAEVGVTDQYDGTNSSAKAYEDALNYVKLGAIEIIEGPAPVKDLGVSSKPAYGWVKLPTTVTEGDTLQIGDTTFEFLDSGSLSAATNLAVSIGVDLATTAANLISAVNESTLTSGVVADTEVLDGSIVTFYMSSSTGAISNGADFVFTATDDTGLATSGSTFGGGFDGAVFDTTVVSRTVTAEDITNTFVLIPTGLPSVSKVFVSVTDSSNVLKYPTSTVTSAGGTVKITVATDQLAENDKVTIFVAGI